MSVKILPLFTYEAVVNLFWQHFQSCDECNEHRPCHQGGQYAELAFRLLNPQPRRSQPDCSQRRRSS